MAGFKIIEQPADESVTVVEVAAQLRYDDDMITPELETEISNWIATAREWCEGYQNRAYVTQTLELALDEWPRGREIILPRPPLQSVESIVYISGDGTNTEWPTTEYIVDDYAFVARIVKKSSWPCNALAVANGVRIRYIAGGEVTSVPRRVKQAIILLAAFWLENGLCNPPAAVYALLNLDRVVPI